MRARSRQPEKTAAADFFEATAQGSAPGECAALGAHGGGGGRLLLGLLPVRRLFRARCLNQQRPYLSAFLQGSGYTPTPSLNDALVSRVRLSPRWKKKGRGGMNTAFQRNPLPSRANGTLAIKEAGCAESYAI